MVEINNKQFKSALNELRSLLNWLIVLEREYGVSTKDARSTRKRIEKVVKHLQDGLK